MAKDLCIYVVHGTRRRLVHPVITLGDKVSKDFTKATVNGESGLLTNQKVVCHQKMRFFVPDKQ